MEAIWDMEDKWKLTTRQALIVLLTITIVSLAAVGLGVTTFLKKRNKKNKVGVCSHSHQEIMSNEEEGLSPSGSCGLLEGAVKRLLMGSLRWSRANKWEDKETSSTSSSTSLQQQRGLLAAEVGGVSIVVAAGMGMGRESHNSESPVWQRPILMGEKCELPRFSGLILYDESGHLLSPSFQLPHFQEKPVAAATRTTIKDLL